MMTPSQLDRVIALCPIAILGGFAVGWLLGAVISGFMLVGLGAMGGSFDKWRTESGLWMLGALFFAIFGLIYSAFAYFRIAELLQGRAALGDWIAVDFALGTAILGLQLRFLWSATVYNRRLS